MSKTSDAYTLGYSAYGSEASNPYEPNTQEHIDWQEGYDDAESDTDGIEEDEDEQVFDDEEDEDDDNDYEE